MLNPEQINEIHRLTWSRNGPFGFQRHVAFGLAEELAVITDLVRRTLEDDVD